jgi:hypothetical protein
MNQLLFGKIREPKKKGNTRIQRMIEIIIFGKEKHFHELHG